MDYICSGEGDYPRSEPTIIVQGRIGAVPESESEEPF